MAIVQLTLLMTCIEDENFQYNEPRFCLMCTNQMTKSYVFDREN
jgi:hypothetical protein